MGEEGEASSLDVVEGGSDEGGVSAPNLANEDNQVAFRTWTMREMMIWNQQLDSRN